MTSRLLRATLLLLGAGLLGPSCSTKHEDRGGLMLEVTTDGSAVDRVDVQISSGDKTLLANTYSVPGETELPTTIAIVSNGDATTVVSIAVIAWHSGAPIDRRDAIVTQIPNDRVAALRVVLSARCAIHVSLEGDSVVSDCGAGTTCDPSSEGATCTDSNVSGSGLGTYVSGAENGDASAGGGAAGAGAAGGSDVSDGASSADASAGAAGESDMPACTKDADCAALVKHATPAGCVVATCTRAQSCVFSAVDADEDHHPTKQCTVPGIEVQLGDDCDDTDPSVFPGAWDGPPSTSAADPEPDHCDEIDQDCDGTPDNGKLKTGTTTQTCACDPNHPKRCYEYPNGVAIPANTLDVGLCHQGEQACTNGVPGACVGAVGPANETCDGMDNDCNGTPDDQASGAVAQCPDADNDMYCASGCKVSCSAPKGYRPQSECLAGIDCDDTSANVHPGATELCGDGIDSNCSGGDSETFTNLGAACVTGNYGVCRRKGSYVCSADKKSTTCNAAVVAAQGGMATAATASDIDTSTARGGYNPLWDWNCDNAVTADVKMQEGAFRAAACSGNYVGACNIYTQAECGQGGFLGATFFNCDTSGGFYLSGTQICGHNKSYIGCIWDWYGDGKCDYLANTLTANDQLTCQ